MFHRLTCRFPFVALFAAFIFSIISCKKDEQGSIETSDGRNTLFVEIDGQRYEPKRGIIGTVDGQPIVHRGVEFTTINNFMVVTKSNFLKNNVYSFVSSAVLNTPTQSMLTFGLRNVFEFGQQNKMKPVVEGSYQLRNDEMEGIRAHITYAVSGEQGFPYVAKPGSGTLTLTRFTNEVISGKMEATLERGEGASYDSTKVILYFDYTMNTINDKEFPG